MTAKKTEFQSIGETMYTDVLENGLTIYTVLKRGFSKSYAFFATNYGGADRRFQLSGKWLDTPAGIAHFLEHKLFDTKDGNALMDLAANGASPNAFTSSEITAYYFQSTVGFYDNLKTLLQFVSVPYFTEESVEKEQGIIGQEIRMINDRPGSRLYYNYIKCLYEHHPARDTVAGTEESIAKITAQTLYDCHKVFYNPSNMVLVVVGDVDADKVTDLARNVLPKEGGEVPVKDYGEEESEKAYMDKLEEKMEVSLPVFMTGTKVIGSFKGTEQQKCEIAGDIACRYIAGSSSPLYSRLYSDGLISSDFSVGVDMGRSMSATLFSGESKDPEKVIDSIKEEIKKIQISALDMERVEKLKKKYTGEILRSLDRFDDICYSQAESHFAGGNHFERMDVLRSITNDDIMNFINTHLKPENFGTSIISPPTFSDQKK